MKFLKAKTSWSNLELGLIKLCLASIYIPVGVYFSEYLKDYLLLFLIIFFITAAWTFILWIRKMKKSN